MGIFHADEARELVSSHKLKGLGDIMQKIEECAFGGGTCVTYETDKLNSITAICTRLRENGFSVNERQNIITIKW